MKPDKNSTSDVNTGVYILKLFICDSEANSCLARANLTEICNENLKGRYQIEEVDVLTDFTSALKERVFVTPALILTSPGPRVTLVGTLDNKERVISALRLRS
jgi:circadian clock protein KaiB